MEREAAATYQEIVQELLRAVPEQPCAIQKKLAQFGFPSAEKYYAVLIRKAGVQEIDLQTLKGLLQTDIYPHPAGAVAILGAPWQQNLRFSSIPGFEKYLKTASLRSGLSEGFFDITKVSIAVKQAEYATRCMMNHNCPCRINSFRSNSTISYLLETCAANDPYIYDMCCHPIMKKLMEYDAENQTDYTNVVVAYVTSNKSVNKTAEALFMHRNTVYQRITKIQDQFGIDFSDHNLVTQIHISALAMQCAGKLDPCALRC